MTWLKEKKIDISDRLKLIALAKLYGDKYTVSENRLTVFNWGKIFHFAVEDNVEYIDKIVKLESMRG